MTLGRPVSQRVIAERLGVSTASVAYALNGRPGVSDELRQRVLALAAELDYFGNPHARALRTGKSGLLAFVVRDLGNPYFLDVIAGSQERAASSGGTIVVVDASDSVAREQAQLLSLAGRGVDGLILSPLGGDAAVALWERIRPDAPLVLLNTELAGHCRVSVDREAAVTLILTELAAQGIRTAGIMIHPAAVLADQSRAHLFTMLAPRFGVTVEMLPVGLDLRAIRRSVTEFLAQPSRPDAIVADCDHHAHEIYAAARELGLVIGRDIAVLGQDDLPTSGLLDPPLTTVSFDRRNIGRALVDRIVTPGLGHHAEPVALRRRASSRLQPRLR